MILVEVEESQHQYIASVVLILSVIRTDETRHTYIASWDLSIHFPTRGGTTTIQFRLSHFGKSVPHENPSE